MDIADANPVKTPLHFLIDFCSLSKKDPYEFRMI